MRARQWARMLAMLILLAGCASAPTDTSASSTPLSTAPAGLGTSTSTSTSPTHATSAATSASGPASRVTTAAPNAPICTAAALTAATNAGRSADSQLTVNDTDVHCEGVWAAVGANDLVNRAQYTFVFTWADGQWQRIPDRSAACAGQHIPAQLHDLACRSN